MQQDQIGTTGTLYVVATPIGNLEDITLRAIRILQEVDFIAAEDTRHTKKLLNHYSIHTKLISYYREKEVEKTEYLLQLLHAGKNIALVSDAGTPGISDPGAVVINAARDAGLTITPIPGPSALAAALSCSGINDGKILFLGFAPAKKSQRQQLLKSLVHSDYYAVFYESPHRIQSLVEDAFEVLGNRRVFMARELTKTYEETTTTLLSELLQKTSLDKNRGEYVIILYPGEKSSPDEVNIDELIFWYRDHSGQTLKDSCKNIAADLGLSRSKIYQRAISIWQIREDVPTMKDNAKEFTNCVTPEGRFVYGIHKPSYSVANLRKEDKVESIGVFDDGSTKSNAVNFPPENVMVESADWIFEIPNPLPFRGATFIDKEWADTAAEDYSRMQLPNMPKLSLLQLLQDNNIATGFIGQLPQSLLLTLATCSTDPEDLILLARLSCALVLDGEGQVTGLEYQKTHGDNARAIIHDHALFEAVANNAFLPEDYKRAMVLRPGAQGASEIVGEWPRDGHTHVFEYLRRNSYIANGHYAANMADDAVRYSISSLRQEDITALRHLYYQRTYVRIAELLKLPIMKNRDVYSIAELEILRLQILAQLENHVLENFSTLWGWNFGFDYAPSNYRLHASHQQIHQQYAMVPQSVAAFSGDIDNTIGTIAAFSSGDMIATVITDYFEHHGSDFFNDYLQAIDSNRRMDGRADRPRSLVVFEDDNILLFVPKAQTSQWELQLMTKPDALGCFPGNVLETDSQCRQSLDSAMLMAQLVLEHLGAKMVTSIEFCRRFSAKGKGKQPLLYSFLPKLPQSPGAFSEAQLRYINGHYPEDFAAVCRKQLKSIRA